MDEWVKAGRNRIGIMAAVHEEIADLLAQMQQVSVRCIGMRDYHEGVLYGRPCVLVLARMGKVAAAATAVTLIREFHVASLLFVGLAGGVAPHVRVGDVVIGSALMQHDMDASPLVPRHEIPLLGCSRFDADPGLSRKAEAATRIYLGSDWDNDVSPASREAFALSAPQVHVGLIASGDQFMNSADAVGRLRVAVPDVLCVEMEGAAVAQICHEYGAAFAVIRTVSDRADNTAALDFNSFLRAVASRYSAGIIQRFLGA